MYINLEAHERISMRVSQIWVLVALFVFGSIFGAAVMQLVPRHSAGAVEARVDAVPEDLLLFVLAGQSNMSGRGAIPEHQTADPRVFVFGNDYRWHIAAEPIDSARDQVDVISADPDAGVGPGLAFAQTLLAERPNARIGLIPCAKGGSSINEWRRSMQDTTLYGACLKRIRAAAPPGQIAGILFFQGEADAFDPAYNPGRTLVPNTYGEVFSSIIEDMRQDIGNPAVPVVFAQIGSHQSPKILIFWDTVRAQQSAVTLACGAMITTDDLPLQDAVHFTASSYRTIGERFASAYLALTTPAGQCK